MKKLFKKTTSSSSAIFTQTVIIVIISTCFVCGLLFLFDQSFYHSKHLLMNSYKDSFFQQSSNLNNSINNVLKHLKMLKSATDNRLSKDIDMVEINKNGYDFAKITKYYNEKDFYQFPIGTKLNQHTIDATIVSSGLLPKDTPSYAKLILMSMDLQIIQRSYQYTHSNMNQSYYISQQQSFFEIYPPIPPSKFIKESKSLQIWLDETYQDVFQENALKKNNPNGEIFWLAPYFDPAGNGMMVTCAVPIYEHKQSVAVVGADVILKFLKQYTNHTPKLPGKLAIITHDGEVISSTGLTYNKNTKLKQVSEIFPIDNSTLVCSDDEVVIYEKENDIIFCIAIKDVPWRYIFSVSKDELIHSVFSDVKGMMIFVILIFVTMPMIFILIFFKSIKPGMRAEKELEQLNIELDQKVALRTRELQESEEYNKCLFENSRIPLVIMDAATLKYTDCNKAAIDIYGFKNKNDVLGLSPIDVSADIQYDGSDSASLAAIHIKEAETKDATIFEWKHQRKSGEVWDAEVQLMCIKVNDNKFFQFSLLDISKRKKAEAEREKLEKQLSQSRKMDAVGQLAGGIAHDFNNMLVAIIGSAQLLQIPARKLDEMSLELVDMIMQASNRAAELTSQMLSFSRKREVVLENINIYDVIDDTFALLEKTLDKKIELIVNKKAKNIYVMGDKAALQNVFINMGINGAHAMKNGGKLIYSITNRVLDKPYCEDNVFNLEPGNYIEIEVKDNGTGITKENLTKIFDPFFTTKPQGEGTGLGLSAVYGIVTDHNGCIDVSSELELGTTFHIIIPVSAKNLTTSKDSKKKQLVGEGHILFVDDEELVRLSAKYTLEDMGYSVTLAEDGVEALKIYKANPSSFNLVVLDMIMPKMSGTETFYKLREINENCSVIISSGFTKNESLNELKKNGLCGFISKPFKAVDFNDIVGKYI